MKTHLLKQYGLQLRPPVYRIHTSVHVYFYPLLHSIHLSIDQHLLKATSGPGTVLRFGDPDGQNPITAPWEDGHITWFRAYTPGFRLARSEEECCYFGLLLFDFFFYFTLAHLSFPLEDVFSVFPLLFGIYTAHSR